VTLGQRLGSIPPHTREPGRQLAWVHSRAGTARHRVETSASTTMKTPKIRLALLLLVSAVTSLIITGCNTVQGVGEDVQHAGYHIKRAAR
jgi:predicted small secreted protein